MIYDFETTIDRTATNAEKYRLAKQLFGTEDVLPAWVADMDLPTPSFVLEAVDKRLKHPVFGYEEFPKDAIEAQIEWIHSRYRKRFQSEHFLYSHSVVASMSIFIQAFSKEGDEVIVQTPVYPPFFKQVSLNGRKVLKNPLQRDEEGHYRFDIKALRRSITPRTKLLLLCNPHNPVGRSWKEEELRALLELCLEHDILVFSDEIHCDLVFEPHRHTPFASLQGAKQITVSAFGSGKSFNMAGFATSSIFIEERSLFERFKEVYDAVHFAQGNIFGHEGYKAAYSDKGAVWLKQLKAHLWHNYTKLSKALQPYAHRIRVTPLEATYLAWLDCTGMGLGDKELREWFIHKAKLGLNPGLSFGREGSGFMRLNFAVSSQSMDEILNRLTKALSDYETELG